MAVVEDFYLGPTHIIIRDDCCVSKEEADEIVRNLSKRIQPHICYMERKREEERQGQEKQTT